MQALRELQPPVLHEKSPRGAIAEETPAQDEAMDHRKPSTSLFDVYLRLRPSLTERERFLDVEQPAQPENAPTHITIKPPADDYRKRAIERFAFTRVFEEDAGQRELFEETGALPLIEGVLGARGREGRDGLLATLGVTGSGKVREHCTISISPTD